MHQKPSPSPLTVKVLHALMGVAELAMMDRCNTLPTGNTTHGECNVRSNLTAASIRGRFTDVITGVQCIGVDEEKRATSWFAEFGRAFTYWKPVCGGPATIAIFSRNSR